MICSPTVLEKFDRKPSDVAFSAVSRTSINADLLTAGDVVSGMALDYISMNVPAKFGAVAELFDSLAGRTRFTYLQYLVAFCS